MYLCFFVMREDRFLCDDEMAGRKKVKIEDGVMTEKLCRIYTDYTVQDI